MVKSLTPEQEQILRHMLGIDNDYEPNPEPYRDYYCANRGDQSLRALEALGMVSRYSDHSGYDWYTTTDLGKDAALSSQRRMLAPKKRRVFRRYLEISDTCPDLTFREFLVSPEFVDARRNA